MSAGRPARRVPSVVTPSGGSPAAMARTPANASPCAVRTSSVGVQDARSSTSSAWLGPLMSPKRTDGVWVTVPPSAVQAAPESSRAPGQPRPRHLGQHRVAGVLGVELGAHEGHHAQRAVPGVLALGVVQQHEPPGDDDLGVVHLARARCGRAREDLGAPGRRVRRQALRRAASCRSSISGRVRRSARDSTARRNVSGWVVGAVTSTTVGRTGSFRHLPRRGVPGVPRHHPTRASHRRGSDGVPRCLRRSRGGPRSGGGGHRARGTMGTL